MARNPRKEAKHDTPLRTRNSKTAKVLIVAVAVLGALGFFWALWPDRPGLDQEIDAGSAEAMHDRGYQEALDEARDSASAADQGAGEQLAGPDEAPGEAPGEPSGALSPPDGRS